MLRTGAAEADGGMDVAGIISSIADGVVVGGVRKAIFGLIERLEAK